MELSDELNELLDREIDSRLSPADTARLEELLRDPGAATEWRRLKAVASAAAALRVDAPTNLFDRVPTGAGRGRIGNALLRGAAVAAVLAAFAAGRATAPRPAPKDDGRVLVRFVYRGAAKSVAVAGSFNGWSKDALLQPLSPGVWSIELPVPHGTHEYGFVVDGARFVPDPAAEDSVDDGFGQRNSRLEI